MLLNLCRALHNTQLYRLVDIRTLGITVATAATRIIQVSDCVTFFIIVEPTAWTKYLQSYSTSLLRSTLSLLMPQQWSLLSFATGRSNERAAEDEEESQLTSTGLSDRKSLAKKRLIEPKTIFKFAHPPPIKRSRQRLKIRPRLLLQVQKQDERRFVPALDVLPSTVFASRLTGTFPKIFKGKESLGPDDLVIVSSDSYEKPELDDEDRSVSFHEDYWDRRDVIGTICKVQRSRGAAQIAAEICLYQGLTWRAIALPVGGYEFNATSSDGSKSKARWVPRSSKKRRGATASQTASSPPAAETTRFRFSLIDPDTRRHPVIAFLSESGIDVLDQYSSSVLEPRPESPPNSPTSITSLETSCLDLNVYSDQNVIKTDHHLRSLVVITGIWVHFMEGWSKAFSYPLSRTLDQLVAGDEQPISPTTFGNRSLSPQLLHRQSLSSVERAKTKPIHKTSAGANAAYIAPANQRGFPGVIRHSLCMSVSDGPESDGERLQELPGFCRQQGLVEMLRTNRARRNSEPVFVRHNGGSSTAPEGSVSPVIDASAKVSMCDGTRQPCAASVLKGEKALPVGGRRRCEKRWEKVRHLFRSLGQHGRSRLP